MLFADPFVKIINGANTYTSSPASLPFAAVASAKAAAEEDKPASGSVEIRLGTLARVQGDVKIVVANTWGKVAAAWFHTSFLQDQGHVMFWKRGLDGPIKDKKHKVFPSNFCGE